MMHLLEKSGTNIQSRGQKVSWWYNSDAHIAKCSSDEIDSLIRCSSSTHRCPNFDKTQSTTLTASEDGGGSYKNGPRHNIHYPKVHRCCNLVTSSKRKLNVVHCRQIARCRFTTSWDDALPNGKRKDTCNANAGLCNGEFRKYIMHTQCSRVCWQFFQLQPSAGEDRTKTDV